MAIKLIKMANMWAILKIINVMAREHFPGIMEANTLDLGGMIKDMVWVFALEKT